MKKKERKKSKPKKTIISLGMSIIVLSGLTINFKETINTNEEITVIQTYGVTLTELEILKIKLKFNNYDSTHYNIVVKVFPKLSTNQISSNSLDININYIKDTKYNYELIKIPKEELLNDDAEDIDFIESNLVDCQDLEDTTSKTYTINSFKDYEEDEKYEYNIENDLDADKILSSIINNSNEIDEKIKSYLLKSFSYSSSLDTLTSDEINTYLIDEEHISNLKEVLETIIENNLITNDKDLTQLYNLTICKINKINGELFKYTEGTYQSYCNTICIYNHTLSDEHLLFHEILHSLIIENYSNQNNVISAQEEAIVENITLDNIDIDNSKVYYEYREYQSLIDLLVVTNNNTISEYYNYYLNEDYRLIYDCMGSTSTFNDEIFHYTLKELFNEETSNIEPIYNLSILNYKNLIANIDSFTYKEHLMFSLIINYGFNTLYEYEDTSEKNYQLYYDEFSLMEEHYYTVLSEYFNIPLNTLKQDVQAISNTEKEEFILAHPDLYDINKLIAEKFYPYYLSIK